MLIKCEVSDKCFKPAIFILKLAKTADFGDAHDGKFLFLSIKCLFSDAKPAAGIKDWCAGFDLSKSVSDLLFGELRFFHRDLLSRGPRF